MPHFQQVAAQRAQEHHEQVTRALRVEGVHLDEMHANLRRRRVEWRHTAIAMGRVCLLWGHWGPRPQERAATLIAPVVARLQCLPVWLSDGWQADPAALVQVLGRVYQRRWGRRGPHPKPRLVPPRDLFDGQVVKVRERQGKRLRAVSRMVSGGPRRFGLERARRGLCAPLRRRTRCGSARQTRHHARVWWRVDLSNVVLPHKRWRQQGRPRPPARAIGLAEPVWS